MAWTERQQAAIEAQSSNLLVAAAAGSGKTAVLTERICGLVARGMSVDRMLVVTYTRAAAAELRQRVSDALQKKADGADALAARFAEQAALVERAQISTLHGLCAALLKAHFQAAGVDPGFRVGDDRETAPLLEEALAQTIAQAYAEGGEDFAALAETYDDAQIAAHARELLGCLWMQPDAEAWLHRALHAYGADEAALAQSPWVAEVLAEARSRLAQARAFFAQAVRLCSLPGGPASYLAALETDLALTDALEAASRAGYEAFHRALSGAAHATARRGKQDDPDLTERAKALRNSGKKVLLPWFEDAGLTRPLADHAEDLRALLPRVCALAALAWKTQAVFDRLKQEKGLLSYADLETKALQALDDPLVAEAVRGQYDAIFVDEYQDSSVMQETLLSHIAGEDNLFLVGDVKQSIYRFRQAEPKLFLKRYAEFSPQAGAKNRRIGLNCNFRSTANVLACVNTVFSYAMQREHTEIEYDEEARLSPAPDTPQGPAAELHLLMRRDENALPEDTHAEEEEAPGEGTQTEAAESPWAPPPKDIQLEAQAMARRMLQLWRTPFYDSKQGQNRPLRWRDMAVLLQVSRRVAPQVQAVLEETGIPVYSDTGGGYFDIPEIRMVMDVLRVVDNPLHEDALLGALHGPMGRFSNQALATIRQAHPEGGFAEAVTACAAKSDALGKRLQDFLAALSAFRLAARAQPLDQLVWRICEDTGCYARAGALPGGHSRQANLRLLAERAAAFSRERGGGLSAFLLDAETLRARGDTDGAKPLSESEDVVRIMTMHKSKGLEFPVVFCLNLSRGFTNPVPSVSLQCHGELGLALRFVDPRLRTWHDTLPCCAIRARQARQGLADAVRLLYVAMTRAQHQLILFATPPRKGGGLMERLARWSAAPEGSLLPEAACMLDLLLPPLLCHPDGEPLRALTDRPQAARRDASRWQVTLARAGEVRPRRVQSPQALLAQLEARELPEAADVAARLAWQPPPPGGEGIRLKTSVSSLLRAAQSSESLADASPLPQFMAQAGQGAARGTAFHAAMRGLNLPRLQGLAEAALLFELNAQLDALLDTDRLTREERNWVHAEDIAPLFASPWGQALLASGTVRREWAFNLRVGSPGEPTQLIQGVLDCCFLTPEGWALLDYKTDAYAEAAPLLARYAPQVALYARALYGITGKPVALAALYLTRHRAVFPYPPETFLSSSASQKGGF
ncbi:MAG: helicase-exonuclease AddAB subunit AddA [Oscillospiraceae bacterium]|nr:helicase-exonuclease AddAB subunit AddA [Oscillospiraceae bacterium]